MSSYVFPLSGYTPGTVTITSAFGIRNSPIKGATTDHKGVDFSAPYGTRVLAAAAGKVIAASSDNSRGNYIQIQHNNGDVTEYEHLSKIAVGAGQSVSSGQYIGEVGSTGVSTGNHLHFGVLHNGKYTNPLAWKGTDDISHGGGGRTFDSSGSSGIVDFIEKNFLLVILGVIAIGIISKIR